MVFSATVNKVQLYHGSQLYSWWNVAMEYVSVVCMYIIYHFTYYNNIHLNRPIATPATSTYYLLYVYLPATSTYYLLYVYLPATLTYYLFYPAMTAFTDQYSLPNIFFDIGQL
jgi:hypothetical protein